MSKEKNVIDVNTDFDRTKVMLETAEILFEEGSENGITVYLEIDNGIRIHFCDDGSLFNIEQ